MILCLNRLRNEFVAKNDMISAGLMGQYIPGAMNGHDAVLFVDNIRYGGVCYSFGSPLLSLVRSTIIANAGL
jgi:hypothetical protein